MLKLFCNNNGVKALNFIYSFRHLHHYSTSSSTLKNGNPTYAKYFVETLGFSKQLACSISSKLDQHRKSRGTTKVSSDFKFVANADSVVQFLKLNGLKDSHIQFAVKNVPQILVSRVDKTLKPKVDFILNFGFSKSDFAEFVSVNPSVLVNGQFIRAIEALKCVMGSDDDVISVMKKSNWNATSSIVNNLIPNVAILRDYGIPIELIRERLLKNSSPFLRKTVVFKDLLNRVEKKLGIPRGSSMFVSGLNVLSGVSEEKFDSKIRMYESFGWISSDVVSLIRRNPYCLALSEARIKRSLEYLMNELGYEPAYVKSHSALLTYSLEKRIVPRNRVLLALKEKGLIRKEYPLYSSLLLEESRFVKKFVLPFEEVHEVYAKYTGRSPVKPLTEVTTGDKP